MVRDAVNEIRIEEWLRLKEISSDSAAAIKGLRYPLLKNPWNLTAEQSDRLSDLQKDNARL